MKIDPLLQELIAWLNQTFATVSSCQGKRTLADFDQKPHSQGKPTLADRCTDAYVFDQKPHCTAAYVYFAKPLPREIVLAARELGLVVYGDHRGIAAIELAATPRPGGVVVDYTWDKDRAVEVWTPEAQREVIEANEVFDQRIRTAFAVRTHD